VKVAYLADVHDHFAALPQAMKKIGPVDLLIVGGDITATGTAEDVERAVEHTNPAEPTPSEQHKSSTPGQPPPATMRLSRSTTRSRSSGR
jgi:Icc-related predicted phosphoesterase